jgi:3-isopropylmalate/(R)-2-methylmalate dehydratase small subunit
MRAFESVSGVAVPFGMNNVDTDMIIPSRWMKGISRLGLGAGAFEAIRANPHNVFDTPRNRGAPILIAGDNFGCGSSREHAPWALLDMGFRAIIASSFADIFAGNCAKNGLVLVELASWQFELLMVAANTSTITVDLEQLLVTTDLGHVFAFTIDPFRRRCMLEGLDEIDLINAYQAVISKYEQDQRARRPWTGLT